MATSNPFDSYTARIHGNQPGRSGMLLCYNSGRFAGRIDFFPDGVAMPEDYLWHPNPTSEYVVLHMPMSRFEAVMSTVREEKPLVFYINVDRGGGASTRGQGYLATSDKEPVGEEEGSP